MTTISGNTITGTSSNDKINADDLVSDTLITVTINGGDGDDELSDFIAKSRLTFINGDNGDDLMSGSSYRNATFADFWITGGYGVDRFYIPGTTSGTPILTRMEVGTNIEHTHIDGSKLSAYVHDSTEIISWKGKDGKAVYYLTEDLSKGRQRAVEFTELYYRTYERPDWYYLARPDTYFEYRNSITPPANTPTYTLAPSVTTINEGSTLTTTVATTNVASGATLYYSLSGTGISAADFSAGALIGSGAVGDDGKVLISHTLKNDLTTEGIETLSIKLFSDTTRTIQVGSTVSVTISDTSVALTYYNPSTNNTLNTWTAYQVTNLVKAGDIVSQWFGTASAATQQIQDISYTKLMDVVASTWADKVQINRVVKASDTGEFLAAKQIDYITGEIAGSVISGGKGNDEIKGFAGWDFLDGGAGDDLIHGGNGRDILTGGAGRDELHGDFGWNTYRSEKDGASDLIAIKSDQFLVNWLYGKAGNSPNGEKSDIIEGLDSIDKIKIIGVDTSEITFVANVATKGVTGIGIYGKGILEALYTGGDLTVAQITQMTSGDASTAAMSNSINAYGVW